MNLAALKIFNIKETCSEPFEQGSGNSWARRIRKRAATRYLKKRSGFISSSFFSEMGNLGMFKADDYKQTRFPFSLRIRWHLLRRWNYSYSHRGVFIIWSSCKQCFSNDWWCNSDWVRFFRSRVEYQFVQIKTLSFWRLQTFQHWYMKMKCSM